MKVCLERVLLVSACLVLAGCHQESRSVTGQPELPAQMAAHQFGSSPDLAAKKKQLGAKIHALYINTSGVLSRSRLKFLVEKGKPLGINAFVMNVVFNSPRYRSNVRWIEEQGMRYIPRIVMYPGGGTHAQLVSTVLFNQRMSEIQSVVDLGAKDVQLDYIRYSSKNKLSKENARVVADVLDRIEDNLNHQGVRLQVDIFGVAAHGPSHRIGQDVRQMAAHVNAICPMVYPSHYEPYKKHSEDPYGTIKSSVNALKVQLAEHPGVAVYPYIEAYNYRYPMNRAQRIAYIKEELRAVEDSKVQGWMIWSAGNSYGNLFSALKDGQV